jgi:hypothetical protein
MCFGAFTVADRQVILYPVDFEIDPQEHLRPTFSLLDGLGAVTLASKEWLGLMGYRLMGWTRELCPASTT